MTSDATAAAKFYGAVVGWKITDRGDPQSAVDYRMIGRGDGGYNGGVLALTADMMDQGARPATPDKPHAKQFYAKHFGFEFKDSMPMGAMGSYDFIEHDGVRLGAITQKPPQNPAAAWLFYFGVESITAAKAAIEKGGGKVMNGPHQVPAATGS